MAVPKVVLTQAPQEPTRKRCRTDSRKSSHREEWNDKDWEDTTSVEDWVSFDWTPKAWVEMLREHGCDSTACKEVMLLAQACKPAAVKIFGKLLKKIADGETIYNPSAFVHRMVKRENETRGIW